MFLEYYASRLGVDLLVRSSSQFDIRLMLGDW